MVTQWGMGHDPDSATLGASGRGTLSFRVVGEDTSLSVGLRAAVDRTINAILDQAYTDAREALLAEMRRLTRVAAYLYEHERIDGAQFEALFDGSLAPSADVETQWRSAKSKPRSWDEIDDLIAMAVATAETSTVARAAAPQPNRPKRGGRRTHPRPTLSSTRALLVNWWQRGSRGVDRPAD
jgi:cell division protease FtsH